MYFDLVRYNFQRPKRETRLQYIHILWTVSLPDKNSDKPEKSVKKSIPQHGKRGKYWLTSSEKKKSQFM